MLRLRQNLPLLFALLCVGIFTARFLASYNEINGYTAKICFGDKFSERSLPALKALPHAVQKNSWGYDGQFYAQLALADSLHDPALEIALDSTSYRARRILFCTTAKLLGLGQPAWILQAYAVQNLLFWLLSAWLLTYWLPLKNRFNFARWFGCLFCAGMISSVNQALFDGPSVALMLLGLRFLESGRPWLGALICGLNGLGRETNVLIAAAQPLPAVRSTRQWLRFAGEITLVVLPLTVWLFLLHKAYGSALNEGTRNFATPLRGIAFEINELISMVTERGLDFHKLCIAGALIAFISQIVFVVSFFRRWREPLWRLAAAYTILGIFLGDAVMEGNPGAYTRVLLPLTVATNLLLTHSRSGRVWLVLINLGTLYGLYTFGRSLF